MKKLFLMFMLLTPLAMAYGERGEIIVSPIYAKPKSESNQQKAGKYALGSGVKIAAEGISGIDGDAVMGLGTGITYNSLKVKGNGINSNSGNLVSIPFYLIFGTGTDNGVYTKLSLGFALRNGSVKWTDSNGGTGKIKARPLTGYAAFGIGVRKERFSVGLSASTSAKAKRTYSSPAKHYRDNIMLSGAAISLDFGYALKYE
ncbi:hypothetical protein JCM16775_0258 [Leptotrichia hofstadii]|uniref:Outer membrane protein beta-barrel domain-containing protein n=1 Tax=Leptotrichia hofstadii TaxID=157688 RepID=A0A510JEA1_9FUSO|nr:hypothetical protein [Leptotrichia hofstadii]BBM37574.1 hypothetical protein JCM16775_0258 [Leptotrichia hofstadii]